MATRTEKIILETEIVDNITGGLTKIKQTVTDLGNGMSRFATTSVRKASAGIKALDKTITKTIPTIKKFKFEWLGVMFAGMALTRTFGGLINTQLELFGVTEMLSATWTTVLLPLMERITPIIMDVLEAFMDMPEGVQLAIGVFIGLAAVLGTVLAFVGQMFLGLGALKMVFAGAAGKGTLLSGVGKALGAVFTGLSATFLIVAGIIIAVIAGMVLAWKSNFLGMKKVVEIWLGSVKQIFGGIITFFKGVMQIVIGLFTGDFKKVGEGIKNIFIGLWDFLLGGFKFVFTSIGAIIIGALKIAYNFIKVIIDAIGWIAGKVGGFFGGSGKSAFSLPSFQTGGVMQNDGLAYLHKGERVLTGGETRQNTASGGGGANITVNATVSSDYDVRRLADKLKEYWVTDFEKTSQNRSI